MSRWGAGAIGWTTSALMVHGMPTSSSSTRRAWPQLSQGVLGRYTLNEQGQGAMRGEVIDALREAFVNALIHADHRANAGVRVIKSRSGYRFINPGLLLVSVSRVWEGGVSEPHNPSLQRMFKLVGLCEREGSGGRLMRAA